MIRLRLATALLLATAAAPALAQPKPTIDQRVDKVEKELRAVQRKVFPGGSPAFFEPEIAAPSAAQPPAGTPASAPLNELGARVDALEQTVAQLTGQVEQDEHRLTLMSEQAAKDRAEFDARLKALEAAAAPPPTAIAPPPVEEAPVRAQPLIVPKTPRPGAATMPTMAKPTLPTTVKPATITPSKPAATKPTPVPVPDDTPPPSTTAASGDAGEDAYMAAYRLWADKKYPQAQAALKAFVAKYPKHKRASYAQNLLGRAFLDDNRPANAAEAFATNYQTNPRGDRAQESLYYLGQSLAKLNKPADACRVYQELDDAYGDKVADNLKPRVATARKDAKCK